MTNKETEKLLRTILQKERYNLSPKKKNGELGTDIIAKRGDEILHIECIGYKLRPHARSKDFFEVFFRAVSRLNDSNVKTCIIALPSNFKTGMKRRVKQYNIAWERIGMYFQNCKYGL